MKRASVLTFGVLALAVSSGCSTQAPAPCQIQTGEYIIRFTPNGTPPAGCPAQFGDVWGFQPFLDENKRVLIAGFSETLGLPDPETDPNYQQSPLYFRGNFTSVDPDSNDLCTIASGSVSDGTVTIELSQMDWLSTALYLGTQFKANATYTDATCAGVAYSAHAINPPVFCESNADCDPFAQPVSSGINSSYNQGCTLDAWATALSGDPAVGVCFFNADFPSLGSFTP